MKTITLSYNLQFRDDIHQWKMGVLLNLEEELFKMINGFSTLMYHSIFDNQRKDIWDLDNLFVLPWKNEKEKFEIVLSQKEADNILDKADVILPQKRKYYIENMYDHYKHTLYIEPLDETRKIIEEKYPEYYVQVAIF